MIQRAPRRCVVVAGLCGRAHWSAVWSSRVYAAELTGAAQCAQYPAAGSPAASQCAQYPAIGSPAAACSVPTLRQAVPQQGMAQRARKTPARLQSTLAGHELQAVLHLCDRSLMRVLAEAAEARLFSHKRPAHAAPLPPPLHPTTTPRRRLCGPPAAHHEHCRAGPVQVPAQALRRGQVAAAGAARARVGRGGQGGGGAWGIEMIAQGGVMSSARVRARHAIAASLGAPPGG